jgi:magnesium chelatase family protein
VLRQPLEDAKVTISRAVGSITYPASIMLVSAMNPCLCGFLGDPQHECTCTPQQVQRYRAKISGPLLDRIDIQVEVPGLRYQELASKDARRKFKRHSPARQCSALNSVTAVRQD